jgi:tRNA-splicing ligase RtcB
MMPRVFPPEADTGVPVLAWARQVPPLALRQLQRLARQPYVVSHVAAMPDVHVSDGVAVGTVFATAHTVVPGALGNDLGCGVRALRLSAPASALGRAGLQAVLQALGRAVPVGDAVHRGRGGPLPPALAGVRLSTQRLQRDVLRLLPRHLGTLGGGNHFLELDRDAGDGLWLLVHSGSRGVGAAVAGHHLRVAAALGPAALAGLDTRTPEGAACLEDMAWALDFARANREALAARALEAVGEALGEEVLAERCVDVHHNHAAWEAHGGRTLLVHRKGALGLAPGEAGVIPGSMGTASYLVEGRGEPRAFGSCSHGAGRVLTRTEARERFRPAALAHALRRVVHDVGRLHALVEEAPAAYRDIAEVLEDEADLVTPRLRLTPLAVLKG